VVRSTVPKIELDDVFTTKEQIADSISDSLKDSMASFGYQILSTPITDIDPDREVKRAMNEINKMKRLRVAAEDEGEAGKIRAVKEAEAEASRTEIQARPLGSEPKTARPPALTPLLPSSRPLGAASLFGRRRPRRRRRTPPELTPTPFLIRQAKADAEAKFLGGQGISRQRQAIMEGLRESVNAFKNEVSGVDAKTVMDLMIVTQYFDMMKDVGSQGKTTAVFLNGGDSGVSGAVAKGFMSGLPAAPGFAMAR